jgi:hypothetical protein
MIYGYKYYIYIYLWMIFRMMTFGFSRLNLAVSGISGTLCSPMSDFMTKRARISPSAEGWKRTWPRPTPGAFLGGSRCAASVQTRPVRSCRSVPNPPQSLGFGPENQGNLWMVIPPTKSQRHIEPSPNG